MSMYKFFQLAIFLCFLTHAQQSNGQTFSSNIVVPPAANTSEFATNLHNSISYQNGANQVSINLMTIKVDNSLEIPINLIYTGSGVKYGATSGEIGVGWSLSTNYRITRTIYSRPDEHYTRPTANQIDSYINGQNKLTRDQQLTQFTEGLPSNGGLPLASGYQLMDGEYDIFDYSTPGYQGSFVVDDFATNKVLTPDNALFKFNFNIDGQKGITDISAYDSKGNLISCGVDPESGKQLQEIMLPSYYRGKSGANAWPVTKITTPNNNSAKFKYILGNISESSLEQQSIVVSETPDRLYPAIPIETVVSNGYAGSGGFNKSNFVDSILCEESYVKFFRKPNSNLIDSICLYDLGQNKIKKVTFHRSAESQYVLLDSISISGKNEINALKYRFRYKNGSSNLISDLWGNLMVPGALDNQKKIPIENGDDSFYVLSTSQPGFRLKNLRNEPLFMGLSGDRERDGFVPDIFSLSKIIFPTGGYKIFFYEPNFYDKGTETRIGPGVRLRTVEDYDNTDALIGKVNYSYSRGFIPVELNADMFCEDKVNLYLDARTFPNYFCGRNRLYSNDVISDNDPFLSRYNIVNYDEVTESNGNGSIVYHFKRRNSINWSPGFNVNSSFFSRVLNGPMPREHRPGYIHTYNLWDKSTLSQKDVLDNNGTLLKTEKYIYEVLGSQDLKGIKVRSFANFADAYTPVPNLYQNIESVYDFGEYIVSTGAQVLKNKTITDYGTGTAVVTTEQYLYNEKNQLTKSIYHRSDQDKLETEYIYPNFFTGLTGIDVITQDVLKMQQKNIVENYIVKTSKVLKNDNGSTEEFITGAEFKTVFPGSSEIRALYKFMPIKPIESFVPVSKQNGSLIIDEQFVKEEEVLKIDYNGNPIYKINKRHATESLIWGYRRRYPVAHIVGMNYEDLKNIYNIDTAEFNLPSNVEDKLLDLRVKLANQNLMVSTFTYEPLIGVSSITSPRGEITTYEYDPLKRLIGIKNHDGKYLKKFSYHVQSYNKILFRNTIKSQSFIKTGCPPQMSPQEMNYVVPAGAYFSTISQADADTKAQQDIASKGQQYVNENGKCYFVNEQLTETFIKNDCEFGKTGSPIVYQVPAGTYRSLESVAMANLSALNEIEENGQIFANQNGACGTFSATVYYNNVFGKDFTKNNCSVGLLGSKETYRVAGGKYSSTTSQLDADNKALNEANANGQAYANDIGECLSKVSFSSSGYPGQLLSITFFGVNDNYSFTADANGNIGLMYVPIGTYRIEITATTPTMPGNFYMSYMTTGRVCTPLNNGYASMDNLIVTSTYNNISLSDYCE